MRNHPPATRSRLGIRPGVAGDRRVGARPPASRGRCAGAQTAASKQAPSLKEAEPRFAVRASRRGRVRANAATKIHREEAASRVKVDFVGWEDLNQQTAAVTSNSGARSRHHRWLYPTRPILRRQDRTDRCTRLSRQTLLWWLAAAGPKIWQAPPGDDWSGLPFRGHRGPLIMQNRS